MSVKTFVALNADNDARWYGLGSTGVGHIIMVPSGFHGDPLACGGMVAKPCGGKPLDTERLEEKFAGDARCKRCAGWLDRLGGADAMVSAREDRWTGENGPGLASAMGEFTLITVNGAEEVTAPAPEVREVTSRDARDAVAASTAGAGREASVTAERERLARQRAKRAAVRENSAPVLPGMSVEAMRDATAAFYANGGKVPDEITALSDPHAVAPERQWDGTDSGSTGGILVCEFTGDVSLLNMERTHGKCPECTTYIPLTGGRTVTRGTGHVSKLTCHGVGSAPASGTQVLREDHSAKAADGYSGKTSAPCPVCSRMIAVNREGTMRRHNGWESGQDAPPPADRIGAHNVGGAATPARKGLVSRSMDTVEHGSVPGDPGTAHKRRRTEVLCGMSGKVARKAGPGVKVCTECARSVELRKREGKGGPKYVYPDHTDARDTFRRSPSGERSVTPRGEGADVGATAVPGARLALARGHGSVDGSAVTGSANMAPVMPGGWLGHAGTGQLPAYVRPGVDSDVSGRTCPVCKELPEIAHKGKTSSWKRRHAVRVRAYRDALDEMRDAKRAAEIFNGTAIPVAERRARRKAASVGSFSEGVNAHTGEVTHGERPEFERKSKRAVPLPKHTYRDPRAE